MSEVLLWLILAAAGLSAVLVGVLLVRFRTLENIPKDLREELRAGREEARRAGKELREEVSGSFQSTNEGLSKTLETMSKAQQAQLDGMAKGLKELVDSTQGALDRLRTGIDSRLKEIREGNEKKLDEMRKTVRRKTPRYSRKTARGFLQVCQRKVGSRTQGVGRDAESGNRGRGP